MHVYEVGKLYSPGRTSWPEGNSYQCRSGSHELLLFLKKLGQSEIKSIKNGVASFGFLYEENIIFFLHKFYPDFPWSDCPYSIHLFASEQDRALPEVAQDGFAPPLQIFLIDAETGILKALRMLGFKEDFANQLRAVIADQALRPFDKREYEEKVQALYEKYPTTDSMLKNAIIM
ncbi:hypothetical protein [Leptospira santarosai]|uniref:hypothetical protein n=1 Tax=Leptospira santarosai TaxID=28183 RepID=UPI0024AF6B8D|nr:hypothetical protein [Leptospira santarosai]MDI7165914.1 hypothetical protein [Leptospira santarosai]